MQTLFTGIVIAVSRALGLAFGLGLGFGPGSAGLFLLGGFCSGHPVLSKQRAAEPPQQSTKD